MGRRIACGGTHYAYAGQRVVEEHDSQLRPQYVYGNYLDEVVQERKYTTASAFTDYWFHTDDMFNTTAVTDSSGAVVERYEYGNFGNPEFYDASWSARSSSAIGNAILFTGRPYDSESGWYQMRARYLDPRVGRFTTRDPKGIWGDAANLGNGYTYANNNPWSYVDPSGLCAQTIKNTTANIRNAATGLWDTIKKMEFNAERGLAKDGAEGEVAKGWLIDPVTGLLSGAAKSALGAATNPFGALGKGIKQAIGLGKLGLDVLENPDTYKANAIEWAGDPRHIGQLGSQTLIAAGGAFVGGEAAAGRAAGLVEEAGEMASAKRAADSLGVCFVAGTLVLLAGGGAAAIETIAPGDYVMARDEATGEVSTHEVVRTFITEDQPVHRVTFELDGGPETTSIGGDRGRHRTETIGVTAHHPFWVVDRGWTDAQDLVPGGQVLTASGGWVRVGSKTWAQAHARVYNLEVRDVHTYFVGESGIWVHNSCAEPVPGQQMMFDFMDDGGLPSVAARRDEFRNIVRPDNWKDYAQQIDNGTISNPFGGHPENIGLMRDGFAPYGSDGMKVVLHHSPALRWGGTNAVENLVPMTNSNHLRNFGELHAPPR